jgi:hypothetical protein
MSITRVAGADRGAGFVATIRLVLPDLLFVLLAVYNAIRLFRHAMWRDELQAFLVAAASPNFAFEPIKRFPEAFVSDERYVIYRVRNREN